MYDMQGGHRRTRRRTSAMMLIWTCCRSSSRCSIMMMGILLLVSWTVAHPADSAPEVSSTVLQMQKLYMTSPPHDTRLYDVLHVSPNATAAQITKSYRNLCRRFHPDKVPPAHAAAAAQQLKQIQDSHDILKDDATRLPYHQYGLTDPNVAVAILLGPHHQHHHNTNHLLDEAHHHLLQLMGYEYYQGDHYHHQQHHSVSLDAKKRRHQRIQYVAARLVERLRPMVEESVSPSLVAHQLAEECDQWKRLPLGAQVIRCVGRAYRHAGQDFLQQQEYQQKKQRKRASTRTATNNDNDDSGVNALDYYSVPVRQQWRKAKDFWAAVLATGKATVTEQVWVQQEKRRLRLKEEQEKRKQRNSSSPKIEYHHSHDLGSIQDIMDSSSSSDYEEDAIFSSDEGGDDSSNDDDYDDEERKHVDRFRAKQTMLTSLQVEALWKVAKIDLDRVIRRACRLILTKEYFFFPSHQTSTMTPSHGFHIDQHQGWVTSRGTVMDADEALQKAAKALVFLGNVMVDRSKAETSWKE